MWPSPRSNINKNDFVSFSPRKRTDVRSSFSVPLRELRKTSRFPQKKNDDGS